MAHQGRRSAKGSSKENLRDLLFVAGKRSKDFRVGDSQSHWLTPEEKTRDIFEDHDSLHDGPDVEAICDVSWHVLLESVQIAGM